MAEKHFHVHAPQAIHVQDQRRMMLDAVLSDQRGAELMMDLQHFIDDAIKNPEHPKDLNDENECRACTIEAMVFRLAAYGIAAYCLDSQKMQETDDGQ